MATSVRRRYNRATTRRTVYKKPAYKKRVYKYKKKSATTRYIRKRK